MPSRKSQGSDDSGRPSLPRLSSIASFQALNPFHRRRSHNATDTSNATSSSKMSTSTSRATSIDPRSVNVSVASIQQDCALDSQPQGKTNPMPDVPASRRADYMHLPDEQQASNIPRSRTFSNLPLPSRMKKPTTMASSKSHTRLPSIIRPPSRIPSPPVSSRRHVNIGVGGTSAIGRVHISKQLQRSDTMPLLQVDTEQVCATPRSVTFKENVGFSPANSTPKTSWKDSFRIPLTPAKKLTCSDDWLDSRESLGGQIPQPQESMTSLPLSRYAAHPAFRSKPYLSSPAFKPSAERLPTPGAPVQRWASQPVLVPQFNPRHSTHGEIKQTRLLSTRAPPTPPPPQTPIIAPQLGSTPARPRTINNASHIRQQSEQSPVIVFSSSTSTSYPQAPPPSTATTAPPSRASTPPEGTISTHEEPAYWAGRFSALNDRYRNEDLHNHFTNTSTRSGPKSQSQDMHSPGATTARQRRALEHLHGLCTTEEAMSGFLIFQLYIAQHLTSSELGRTCTNVHPILLAQQEREREWRERVERERETLAWERRALQLGEGSEPRTPVALGAVGGEDAGGVSGGSGAGRSEGRKASFMERLLGRRKRPSGSDVTP